MDLPNIEHVTARKKASGATEVIADAGYVFYDKNDYEGYTDNDGNPCEVPAEEICYFRYMCFAYSITAEEIEERVVVVAESEVPDNQIFSAGNNPEIM